MTEPVNIRVECTGRVGKITLHRPEVLNALNFSLVRELIEAALSFDADPNIGAIVITGSEKAFAAGADIAEMAELGYGDFATSQSFPSWDAFERMRTPVIAAVAGYALGGGCELALMCDIVLAAENARFGQPEIQLGILPGFGGSQRLPRVIGYAKAAEMVLTGRLLDAEEAERAGLVSRVVPTAELHDEALRVANVIAEYSLPAVYAAKAALQVSQQTTLAAGIAAERQLFAAQFATADQKEGMRAFLAKRAPKFTHR